jgi:hypothetical protein
MPGADELFRGTAGTIGNTAINSRFAQERLRAVPDPVEEEPRPTEQSQPRAQPANRPAGRPAEPRRATGRERHDEKITVYVSPEELLGLEQARICLRAMHGMAVDRGRIVREAIDVILADLEENGELSMLVRSLRNG